MFVDPNPWLILAKETYFGHFLKKNQRSALIFIEFFSTLPDVYKV